MHNQIYFYQDNNFNVSYNRFVFFGDYGSLQGGDIKYIPVGGTHDGWQFWNYINNFYTNFIHKDTSGSDVTVLRLHYSQIKSMVNHEFIGNIIVNSTTITPTELSYLDGVTSNIQNQLNLKAPLASPTFTDIANFNDVTIGGALITNGTNTFNNKFKWCYITLLYS